MTEVGTMRSSFQSGQKPMNVPAQTKSTIAEPRGSGPSKENMSKKALMDQTTNMSEPLNLMDINKHVEDKKRQILPRTSPEPRAHKDFVHANPPGPPTYRKYSVFTAGSIEMGKAVKWQQALVQRLSHLPITVCNPRKGHWDPNVTQQAKDNFFKQQVEWELASLEQVDVICFFFDVETKSPVSLLELGLWAASDKVVVCCGDEYHRSGNVHLTCERYGIPYFKTFEELAPKIESMLKEKGMEIDDKGGLVGENVHVLKEKPKKKTQLEEDIKILQERIKQLEAQLKV